MFPGSTPLPHWDKTELEFHLEIFHSSSGGAGKPPWLQVTGEGKGQRSKFQAKFTSVPDWDEKAEGKHGALLSTSSRILLGEGSVESWARQRGGQSSGPAVQREGNSCRRPGMLPGFRMTPHHPPIHHSASATVPLSPSLLPFITPQLFTTLFCLSPLLHTFISFAFFVHFYFLSFANLTFLPTLQPLRHDSVPALAQSMPPCDL